MWEILAAIIGASGNIAGITSITSFFEYELPVMRGRVYVCVGLNVRKEGQHSLCLLSKYIHFLHPNETICIIYNGKI